jgi:hypothetical protein
MRTAGLVLAQGHHHVVEAPVSIGPLILRIALMTAILAITAFAILRAVIPEPSRATVALVVAITAGTVLLELMLSNGFRLPSQVAVLVIAAAAIPLYPVSSSAPAAARIRVLAPWVVLASGLLAFGEFVRAWLGSADSLVAMNTGVLFALVGLSWFAVSRPTHRRRRIALRAGACVLASVTFATAVLTSTMGWT